MAEVLLISWPAGAHERAAAACAGRPRLLLVAPGSPPPVLWERIEDWVREPVDADELQRRVSRLARLDPSRPSMPVRRAVRASS